MRAGFMREFECQQVSGLSRSTRWRLEKEGLFPKRRQIGKNAIGWLKSEIDQWISTRQPKTTWPAEHRRCE